MSLTPAQIKPKSFESRRNSSLFLPGVDAPHVYVRAWALGCFHSLFTTQTFRRALTASLDSWARRQRLECPFCGATGSGRVRRQAPESDARSVDRSLSKWAELSDGKREVSWCVYVHVNRLLVSEMESAVYLTRIIIIIMDL